MQKEEEVLLLYDIVGTLGTQDSLDQLTSSPTFGPLTLFRNGQKELLLRVINMHSRRGRWADVFQLCREALSEKLGDGSMNLLGSDYSMWEMFINAASHIMSVDET